MKTLLLRLCGPFQSWGTESRFEQRGTGLEPSKSGVVGLLAAALGRERGTDIRDLTALRMGVRTLQEGVLQSDFQTAGATHRHDSAYGVARFDGSTPQGILLTRYYLADADFLVGLEAPDDQGDLLAGIDAALRRPHWPLSLGRKSYIPSVPVALPRTPPQGPGIRPLGLREALLAYPWAPSADKARFVFEDPDGEEERHDQPVDFTWGQSRYLMRRVHIETIDHLEEETGEVKA